MTKKYLLLKNNYFKIVGWASCLLLVVGCSSVKFNPITFPHVSKLPNLHELLLPNLESKVIYNKLSQNAKMNYRDANYYVNDGFHAKTIQSDPLNSPVQLFNHDLDPEQINIRYIDFLGLEPDFKELTPEEVIQQRQGLQGFKKLLDKFLANNPKLKPKFAKAAGIAIFDMTDIEVAILTVNYGYGALMDFNRNQIYYINRFRIGSGYGLGLLNHYYIVVFDAPLGISQYVGAKGGGGDFNISAYFLFWGKTITPNYGISLYQIYKSGILLEVDYGPVINTPNKFSGAIMDDYENMMLYDVKTGLRTESDIQKTESN